MKKDLSYKFQVSISRYGYETKQQTRAAITGDKELMAATGIHKRIGFYSLTVTSQELLDRVLHGHTFCTLFSDFPPYKDEIKLNRNGNKESKRTIFINEDGDFTMAAKADEFFKGSYFIGIDMDENSFLTSQSLVDRLSLPPTFWYTSFSHMQIDKDSGESKGVRLRLIYVFDQIITDKFFFRYCSWTLHKMIENDIDEPLKDNCGIKCSQYFNGTNCNDNNIIVESGLTSNIYSYSDINVSDKGYYEFLLSRCYYAVINEDKEEEILKRINSFSNCSFYSQSNITQVPPSPIISEWGKNERLTIADSKCVFDDKLLNDFCRLRWYDFYGIYRHLYPYVYRVEKDEWLTLGDIKYQLCDKNYLELLWIPKRITNGHHRRNTLFHRAWLRRVIMPTITPSILLFNLMVDRERFFDNTDGVLSLILLKNTVRDSFMYEVDELKRRYSKVYESTKDACKNKQFIIHRNSKKDVKPRHIKKELRWKMLDVVYNPNQTFDWNLHNLKYNGLSIDDSTLYRYCSDRGVKIRTSRTLKFERFRELHQSGMSIRKEQEYLKNRGLELSTSTISSYIDKLQSEPNKT